MIFLAVAIQYTQKIDMSIAIVCMVNNTVEVENNQTSIKNKQLSHTDITNDLSTCMFQPKNGTSVHIF